MDTWEPDFSLSADMLILMDDALSVLFDCLAPYLTRVNPTETSDAIGDWAQRPRRRLWQHAV